MRVFRVVLAWLLLCTGAFAQVGQIPDWPPAKFVASGGSGLSLDGSVHANTSSGTVALALTTTKGSGQIVVLICTNAASVTSVTATGLTFNLRKAYSATFGCSGVVEYAAAYTTNFSGTITVTLPTATFTTADAFGIGNANTTAGVTAPPYDANGSLPASNVSTVSSVTTSNATDFIFGFCSLSSATDTASGTWTTLPGSGANFALTEYQIVSSTQTALAMTTTGGFCNGSIADAIVH